MLAASLVKQTNIKLSFGAFLWGLKESWPWDADWKYQKNVHINGHIADAHVQSFTGLRYIYIYVCVRVNSSIIKNPTHIHTVSL